MFLFDTGTGVYASVKLHVYLMHYCEIELFCIKRKVKRFVVVIIP